MNWHSPNTCVMFLVTAALAGLVLSSCASPSPSEPSPSATIPPPTAVATGTEVQTPTPQPSATPIPSLWDNPAFQFEKSHYAESADTQNVDTFFSETWSTIVLLRYQDTPPAAKTLTDPSNGLDPASPTFAEDLSGLLSAGKLSGNSVSDLAPGHLSDPNWLAQHATAHKGLVVSITFRVPFETEADLFTTDEEYAKSLYLDPNRLAMAQLDTNSAIKALEIGGTHYYQVGSFFRGMTTSVNIYLTSQQLASLEGNVDGQDQLYFLLSYKDGSRSISGWPEKFGTVPWDRAARLGPSKGSESSQPFELLVPAD